MATYKVLIADDQDHILQSLCLLLEPEGFVVTQAQTPAEVLGALEKRHFDLVLIDMNYQKDTTSGDEGIALVTQIRQKEPVLPIVVMTAWANIELSVSAMQSGANDFIEKPWNNNRLVSMIRNQIDLAKEKSKNQKLTELTRPADTVNGVIASAPSMQPVMQLIERTAGSDANILLTGESGVGKSLFANLIHGLSERNALPIVSVNMGALSDSLFENELFGHLKGAFTDAKSNRMGRFEMADNSTLFLDEIANIPKPLQGKLLRVLESGEFEQLGSSKTKRANVRIISASNVNFDEEIAQGRFRQDLLYRLNTITIDIPPLRQRREDILPLANAFLSKLQSKYRRSVLAFASDAQKGLKNHGWPGNVRELSHCIERAVLMAQGAEITLADLGLGSSKPGDSIQDMTLEQAERMLIANAINSCDKNMSMAADKLGISRAALYRRLEKYEDIFELAKQDSQ